MTGGKKRITRIEPQKKTKGRFSLFLDDQFAFGIHQSVLLEFQLARGDELDESTIRAIQRAESVSLAKQKGLALIAYRRRSVEELRARLEQKGFEKDVVRQVLEDFLRVNLLDDKAFAEAYTQTRLIEKPVSKRQMTAELKARGIRETEIQNGIEAGYENTSDEAIATQLVKKRLQRYTGDDPLRIRKKLSDFLIRRGFDWDTIRDVLDAALDTR